MPTISNPFIQPSEIEHARRQMSDRAFRQEFLAEFMEDGTVFRNVRELATGKLQTTGYQGGHIYTMGIDWGRSGDYTVLAVYDATDKAVVHLDRFTGQEFRVQLGRVPAAIETWRPLITVVELNSIGRPLFEQLQQLRLPTRLQGFTTTNQSKALLVDALALTLERREIILLDHPVLIAELQAYQAEILPGGMTRYAAPAGGHDDCMMALMLAYHAAHHSARRRRPRSREYGPGPSRPQSRIGAYR
jgi:hypothetical protein